MEGLNDITRTWLLFASAEFRYPLQLYALGIVLCVKCLPLVTLDVVKFYILSK